MCHGSRMPADRQGDREKGVVHGCGTEVTVRQGVGRIDGYVGGVDIRRSHRCIFH